MTKTVTPAELGAITRRTLRYYEISAETFEEATRDHDVSQNYTALLDSLEASPPFLILDFGCGPGRDLRYFRSIGHRPTGLDGCGRFVSMARQTSGCEVFHQDFLNLALPRAHFHGVFANASLFHVPSPALAAVLGILRDSLVERGVLFCSNPHGQDTEGVHRERYGVFYSLSTWRKRVVGAGFEEIAHYYRPAGKPRNEQPWLATVWRKAARAEIASSR